MIPAIVVFLYLAAVLYIGIFAFRRASSKEDAEDYFLASVKNILLVLAVLVLYVLHQDIWFWRSSYLVFGFIPIGLFYQGCFSIAAALLMWLLVTYAWPSHLEEDVEEATTREDRRA